MADAKSRQTRQLVLLGILVVLAGWVLVRWLSHGTLAGEARQDETVEYAPHRLPQLVSASPVETLDGAAETGRNPFTYGAPPTPTRNLTPPPTRPPVPTRPPPPPRPTPTPYPGGKKPPPPFDRIYIGNFGPGRLLVAVFRKGDDIEVAIEGGVLDHPDPETDFILREIGLESVEIGFVGYPEEVTTRVPISEN